MPEYPYDGRDPPAPILPVRVGPPGEAPAVLLAGLVDTGADISTVPEVIARELRLPPTGRIGVEGVDGTVRRVTVYAAEVETEAGSELVEVAGVGTEPLLGRDLLNLLTIVLHGPSQMLELRR